MNTLTMISGAQLALGLAGLRKAVRDRTCYDIGFMRGSPDTLHRDLWVLGTNLSAPVVMLILQAAATAALRTRHHRRAARTLGVLGTIMTVGYPAERSVRLAWRRWESPAAPLTATATALAMGMAVLGSRTLTHARQA